MSPRAYKYIPHKLGDTVYYEIKGGRKKKAVVVGFEKDEPTGLTIYRLMGDFGARFTMREDRIISVFEAYIK